MVRVLILLLALVAATPPAGAQGINSDGASGFINELGNDAVSILQSDQSLEQRQQRLEQLFRRGFALDFIGQFVLGRYWKQASPEQQQTYLKVFSDFVVQSYARQLADEKVSGFTITSSRNTDDQDALVQTEIQRPNGPPLAYGWRVRTVDGKPQVVDVMVENVSLVVTHRSEFASVVQRDGIDGLIEALRRKTG